MSRAAGMSSLSSVKIDHGSSTSHFEVGARDRVFGRRRLHDLEPFELLERDLFAIGGHLGRCDLLAEIVQIPARFVDLAQFFLDGLELLAQDVLALVPPHLLLHLGVDLFAHLEHLVLARQELQHAAQARLEVEDLQDFLLLVDLHVEVGGDEIGELARLADTVEQRGRFLGKLGHQFDDPLGDVFHVHHQSVELGGATRRVRQDLDLGHHVGILRAQLEQAHARHSLQDDRETVLGQLDDLQDPRGAAHGIQVGWARLLHARIALGDDADDRLFLGDRLFDQLDGLLAPHIDGNDRVGKQDGIAQGKDRQELGDFDRSLGNGLLR